MTKKVLYPTIKPIYAIRGTRNRPFLVNLSKIEMIPLENQLLTTLLSDCNGLNSTTSLARKYSLPASKIQQFLLQFASANILKFYARPRQKPINLPIFLAQKDPWLREVHLDITNRCNLADQCRHCFRGDKLNKGNEPDFNQWKNLINDLSRLGVYNLTISGGEPTLRPDLVKIVRHIIKKRMFLGAIFTNGTNWNPITEQIVALLVKHKLHTTFYISLDGPNAPLHDANRGLGAYRKTLRFIQRLIHIKNTANAPFKIAINSQVTSENSHLLLSWYQSMMDLGVNRWRLTSGRVTGRLKQNNRLVPSWTKLFPQYKRLIHRHIHDRKQGASLLLSVEGFFNTGMLDSQLALTFTPNTHICDYKENACSIEPNGEVQFCTSWGGQSFGNVFDKKIGAIWHSRKLQALKTMKISQIDECRDCELLNLCGGGCRLVAKNIKAKDPYACQRYRRFKKHILPLLQAEGIQFRNSSSES